jgi:transcriptional regulator with XRE-family HTH domain
MSGRRNPAEEQGQMPKHSRWRDVKEHRPGPTDDERAAIEQRFALGELIYELRTNAGLSQRELAERMGTTQSVISRLEEGGGGRPRLDTLARVATALDRHLVVARAYSVPRTADTSRTQRTTRDNLNGDTSDIPPAQQHVSAGHGAARRIRFDLLPS